MLNSARAHLLTTLDGMRDRLESTRLAKLSYQRRYCDQTEAAIEQNPNGRAGIVSFETFEQAEAILTVAVEKLEKLLGDPGKSV